MANNIQTSTCLTFQLSETIPYENAGFFRDLIYISEEKKIDIGTMKYLAFRIFLDDETEPV